VAVVNVLIPVTVMVKFAVKDCWNSTGAMTHLAGAGKLRVSAARTPTSWKIARFDARTARKNCTICKLVLFDTGVYTALAISQTT
jgi:hypothetical protein